MRCLTINYFATAGLNDIVFTIFLPSSPGHLVPCTLDNVGTILCYQTSNVILINATLLFVHFLSCLNFMSLFYVYTYVLCELFFIHNVVRLLSCVTHVLIVCILL